MKSLFDIISKMTKGERLFFRRPYQQRLPHFVQLYDIVINNASLTLAEMNALLKAEFGKQLNYIKHQLVEKLLHSIMLYAAKDNAQIEILQEIAVIKTLRFKKHNHLAKKRLQKVFKHCLQLQEHNLLELLLQEQFKLEIYDNLNLKVDEYNTLLSLSKSHANSYTQLLKLRIIYDELIFLKKESGFFSEYQKNQYDRVERDFEQLDASPQDSHDEYFLLFYFSQALFLVYRKKSEEAQHLIKSVLLRLKVAENFVADNHEFLIEAIRFYRSLICLNEDFVESLWLLEYMETKKVKYPQLETQLDLITFLHEIKYSHAGANYVKARKLLSENESKFDEWLNISNLELQSVLIGSISISYFIAADYENSYWYISRLLKTFKNNVRHDIISFANMFAVLVSYELKNESIFKSQVVKSINHFKKNRNSEGGAIRIIQCLSKTFFLENFEDRKRAYQDLKPMLKENKHDQIQQMLYGYFDFKSYFESKIERVGYKEYKKSLIS